MVTKIARIPVEQKKSSQLGVRWPDDRKQAWEKLAERQRRTAADLARVVLEEYMTSFMPYNDCEALGLAAEWRAAGLLELAMDQRADRKQVRSGR